MSFIERSMMFSSAVVLHARPRRGRPLFFRGARTLSNARSTYTAFVRRRETQSFFEHPKRENFHSESLSFFRGESSLSTRNTDLIFNLMDNESIGTIISENLYRVRSKERDPKLF